jgi:hypothetical protein
LAAIMLSSIPSLAQRVDLICRKPDWNTSVYVTFDETRKVAAIGDQPVSQANFTEKEITWRSIYNRMDTVFLLERVEGAFYIRQYENGKAVSSSGFSCSVLQKKF